MVGMIHFYDRLAAGVKILIILLLLVVAVAGALALLCLWQMTELVNIASLKGMFCGEFTVNGVEHR